MLGSLKFLKYGYKGATGTAATVYSDDVGVKDESSGATMEKIKAGVDVSNSAQYLASLVAASEKIETTTRFDSVVKMLGHKFQFLNLGIQSLMLNDAAAQKNDDKIIESGIGTTAGIAGVASVFPKAVPVAVPVNLALTAAGVAYTYRKELASSLDFNLSPVVLWTRMMLLQQGMITGHYIDPEGIARSLAALAPVGKGEATPVSTVPSSGEKSNHGQPSTAAPAQSAIAEQISAVSAITNPSADHHDHALTHKIEIHRGETLSGIALRELHDASRWKEIAELNHITKPYVIFPTEEKRLEIPQWIEKSIEEKPNYTVQKDDTLEDIAWKTLHDRRRWPEIYQLNKDKLKHPDRVLEGQELLIPENRKAPHPQAGSHAEPASHTPATGPVHPVVLDRIRENLERHLASGNVLYAITTTTEHEAPQRA